MLCAYSNAPIYLRNKTAAEIAESEDYCDIAEKINKFERSKRIAALSLSPGKKLPPSKLSQISTEPESSVGVPVQQTGNSFLLYTSRVPSYSELSLLKAIVIYHARKRLEITPAPDQENGDTNNLKRQRRE
jgi:hypothetical protein